MFRQFWSGPSVLERSAQEIGMRLLPEHRAQIAHGQMRMVLQHTRLGTMAATAFALMLAWYLHHKLGPGLPQLLLGAWVAVKLLVAGARIVLAAAWPAQAQDTASAARWQQAMLALLALDGLVWGVAGWAMMDQSVPLTALVVAALDGVSCVATFGLQVRLAATAAYVLPMLLPLAFGLAQRHDDIAYFAAIAQLLLAALLLATARATSQQLATGMLLRLQADALVAEKDAALRLAHEQSAERKRFLAKVSHELRTPLHGMLGLTRLLHLEASDQTLSHRLELIESSGTHLLGLINDLLEVSRIEAGHFVLKVDNFDLAALLDQQAELFALRAADKGLHFALQLQLPRPFWVRGDAARLRQVLNNLLGNAVKFTRRGTITLQAWPGAGPERVGLSVADTGDGIGPAELARIFQPFHQATPMGAPGTAATTDGVGLGLTIAREIAMAMGSDIQVRSVPGQGSVFSFEALLPPAGASAQAQPSASTGQRLPRLVLVAEDDEVNALIVGAYLDSLGVRYERVADGKQAVSRALRETDRPEMVLMDCRMPVMDGLAATADIRRQERTLGLVRLPIVALTATATDSDRQACLDVGMDDVIAKPFTPVQLADALRQASRAR
jgi:signal transduction histidine kinase/ActR/RegA family two-component response regulator